MRDSKYIKRSKNLRELPGKDTGKSATETPKPSNRALANVNLKFFLRKKGIFR